jgi:hypothetical protein
MSARNLPLFDALSAGGDPPAPAASVSPARAAAAVDPALADDPAEVTLRGEHDPDADPRMLRAERIADDYRQARDCGDHETAEAAEAPGRKVATKQGGRA